MTRTSTNRIDVTLMWASVRCDAGAAGFIQGTLTRMLTLVKSRHIVTCMNKALQEPTEAPLKSLEGTTMGNAAKVRYSVSVAQASICASFLADMCLNGEDYSAPIGVIDAMNHYVGLCDAEGCGHVSCRAAMSSVESAESVEELREAIERWLLVDRSACVSLLGPGLGIDQ